jgi:hypothetical protein
MGDVKQNMSTTMPKSKGLWDRIRDRKKARSDDGLKGNVKSDEEIASSFADYVALADDKIEQLIASKQKDLANEKGQEDKNKKKIKLLQKMQEGLEDIAELVEEYKDL